MSPVIEDVYRKCDSHINNFHVPLIKAVVTHKRLLEGVTFDNIVNNCCVLAENMSIG
jgi:hypothetical protein